VPFSHPEGPTHPEEIVIEIIGITACDHGCSCEEHPYCREISDEDVVVCFHRVHGPGQEVTAVVVYWVTNGIEGCRMGCLPHHTTKYAAHYDGVLAQVTEISSPVEKGDKEVCENYHRNKGFCRAIIISALNNN
jgi:hypothetical protein